jgi:hypothetical protein
MARPTKLIDAAEERILKALRAGAHRDMAAHYAGIDRSTLYRWLERGAGSEPGEEAYQEFRAAVEQAESESELRDLTFIGQAGRHDWRAAAWRLERRHRARWARQAATGEAEEPGTRAEQVMTLGDYNLGFLSDADFDELLRVLEAARIKRPAGQEPPPAAEPEDALPDERDLWETRLFRGVDIAEPESRKFLNEELGSRCPSSDSYASPR